MRILLFLLFISLAEGFDESFDPIEFVASVKDEPQELNFTMPDTVATNDPYNLLDEVDGIKAHVDSLMSQIEGYLDHFNNVTGPEAVEIQDFVTAVARAQKNLKVIQDRKTNAEGRLENITVSLSGLAIQLHCYQDSNCHPVPITTTLSPAPDYNCSSTATNQTVTYVNQTGQFRIASRQNFGKCNLTLKAESPTGLMFNLSITDFTAYDSTSSLLIIPDGSGKTFNITSDQQINGITNQFIDIIPSGQLKFTINYIALDTCEGANCGNGICNVAPGNKPICKCDSCYQQDANGKCTIHKPDPCDQFGEYCTAADNGTCVTNSWDCTYYCKCPGVSPTCTTLTYCDPNNHDCPPQRSPFLGRLTKLIHV
ncbi:hypothetical protein FO519_004514 [Halicephalobus sp. NKZ332]|nr:hypothetical protein FO519_004514 [Halicephalobus sp. NKZ332]